MSALFPDSTTNCRSFRPHISFFDLPNGQLLITCDHDLTLCSLKDHKYSVTIRPVFTGFCNIVIWAPAKKGTSVTLDCYGIRSQVAVTSSGREILILFLSNDRGN